MPFFIEAVMGIMVWMVLQAGTHMIFESLRAQHDRSTRLRPFLIKLDAMRFLVKWGLLVALFAYEGYVVLKMLAVYQPSFLALHKGVILVIYQRLRMIAFIVVGAITLIKLGRLIGEAVMSRARTEEGNGERERRAQTLISAVNGTVTTVVIVIAILMILDVFELPIAPLLTGAGLAGVALAFSAQSLLRDIISGFFIIMEDQYKIGDVVRLGDRTGTVERVTLRTTSLRDENGALHIVPNSEVKVVTNSTTAWSATNVDISLPFMYDPQQVTPILERTVHEVSQDLELSPLLLESPRVLGLVDATAGNSIYRITVRTRGTAQSRVGMEIRRRSLAALAAENIRCSPPPPANPA